MEVEQERSGTILLGSYRGFDEATATATFENGDFCEATGKPRSATVTFSEDCGADLALTSVQEIATCEYSFELSGACFLGGCGLREYILRLRIKHRISLHEN